MSVHSAEEVAFLVAEARRQCDVILELLNDRRTYRELLSLALTELHRLDREVDRLRAQVRAGRADVRESDAA